MGRNLNYALFLLLKLGLCFPDEITSFAKQHHFRTGRAIGSVGFAFQLGLFILQAH